MNMAPPPLHTLLIFVVNAKWVYCPWNGRKAINKKRIETKRGKTRAIFLYFIYFHRVFLRAVLPLLRLAADWRRAEKLVKYRSACAPPLPCVAGGDCAASVSSLVCYYFFVFCVNLFQWQPLLLLLLLLLLACSGNNGAIASVEFQTFALPFGVNEIFMSKWKVVWRSIKPRKPSGSDKAATAGGIIGPKIAIAAPSNPNL